MKNRSTLLLMEIGIMLLVFAMGAALCLYIFTQSDDISRSSRNLDIASRHVQNIAEILKSTQGDFAEAAEIIGCEYSGSVLELHFDKNWNITTTADHFRISVFGLCSDSEEMCSAKITVTEQGINSPLFTITSAWQRRSVYE